MASDRTGDSPTVAEPASGLTFARQRRARGVTERQTRYFLALSFAEHHSDVRFPLMPELTPEELRRILDRLEEVSRQAQELQEQLRQKMVDRARSDSPARSAANDIKRSKRKR